MGFKEFVREEKKLETKSKPKAKKKEAPKQQRQKPKQSKSTSQSTSPIPSPTRTKSKPSPSPKPTKYVPPRRDALPRDPRVDANGRFRNNTNNSNGVNSNSNGAPQPMTFARKMAAKRAKGGVEAASVDRGSFSGRFSRGSGDSMMGGNRGAMNGGGRFQDSSRPRPRMGFDDDNNRNNGDAIIRPKAHK